MNTNHLLKKYIEKRFIIYINIKYDMSILYTYLFNIETSEKPFFIVHKLVQVSLQA